MWKFTSIVVLVVCLAWAVYCEDQRPPSLKTRFGRSADEPESDNYVSNDIMEKRSAQRPPSLKTRFGRSEGAEVMEKRSAQRPPSLKTRFGRSVANPESDGYMRKRSAERPFVTRIRHGRANKKRAAN
ncbi:head peptide [Aedes aegypti]|uniref:Uncharacterized protein n=1 Tax=Aedes aegypti TaxID=7159 RepID=A0A6I8U4N6_AEDAE|nr:head peptide [Aedes aegypti]